MHGISVNGTMLALVGVAIVLDVITGLLKAWSKSDIKSAKMREGLQHKMGFIVFIAIGCYCDILQQSFNLGTDVPTGLGVCVYVIASELVSMAENLAESNTQIAKWPILKQLATVGKILEGNVVESK